MRTKILYLDSGAERGNVAKARSAPGKRCFYYPFQYFNNYWSVSFFSFLPLFLSLSSHSRPPLYDSFTLPSTRKEKEPSPPKETNIPPPTVVAPVKLAAPIPEGTVMVDVQPSTKPGMEGVQETAGKIAVERKLQDEVIISSSYFKVLCSRETFWSHCLLWALIWFPLYRANKCTILWSSKRRWGSVANPRGKWSCRWET